MDVRPVGAGPGGIDFTQRAAPVAPAPKPEGPGLAGAGQAGTSIDAAILSALSEPDLARLVAILEPPQDAQSVAQLNELVRAVMTAAAAGDVEKALQGMTEITALNPIKAEAVRADSGIEPIRAQVESLFARLTNVAKLEADGRLAQASQVVEEGRMSVLPEWDVRPETLLLIASRMLEAGGHVNSVRAAQVAQVVIDASRWAPGAGMIPAPTLFENQVASEVRKQAPTISPVGRRWTRLRARGMVRLAKLWRRAPLLVLLVAWLIAGTVGGLVSWAQQTLWPDAWPPALTDAGFSLWGLGFLALVLFGFYSRVRNVRL